MPCPCYEGSWAPETLQHSLPEATASDGPPGTFIVLRELENLMETPPKSWEDPPSAVTTEDCPAGLLP